MRVSEIEKWSVRKYQETEEKESGGEVGKRERKGVSELRKRERE